MVCFGVPHGPPHSVVVGDGHTAEQVQPTAFAEQHRPVVRLVDDNERGDGVFDGTVIAVDSRLGNVTFRQKVDDPRRIKPYRDVVMRLVPMEDEEIADE